MREEEEGWSTVERGRGMRRPLSRSPQGHSPPDKKVDSKTSPKSKDTTTMTSPNRYDVLGEEGLDREGVERSNMTGLQGKGAGAVEA